MKYLLVRVRSKPTRRLAPLIAGFLVSGPRPALMPRLTRLGNAIDIAGIRPTWRILPGPPRELQNDEAAAAVSVAPGGLETRLDMPRCVYLHA